MITQSCGEVKRLLDRDLVQHLPTIGPPPVEARPAVEPIRSTLADRSGTGFRAWWWSPVTTVTGLTESVMIAIGGGMAQQVFRGAERRPRPSRGAGAGPGKWSPWLKIRCRGKGEPSRISANAT